MVNVKNIILGIGIVVVYALVLWQGTEAFYPSPQYDDFCRQGRFEAYYPLKPIVAGEPNCNFSRELQKKQNQCYTDKGQPVFEYDDKGCIADVNECDYCQRDFDNALDTYSKIVFIIAIIMGIITLIAGYSILSVEPVGSALMGSGIWAIFWGAAINWRNFSSVLRFLLLLIALIVIIWFALRLNRSEKKNIWQKIGIRK